MKKSTTRQIIAGCSATMSTITAGFHYGWPTPSLPKLLADDSDVTITSDESSWIVSFMTIGFALGPFVSITLVNRWGRKWTLLLTALPYLGSAILLGLAQNSWMFLIARFIAGFGIGITLSVLAMYLGEIAEDSTRGALCTLITQTMNVSILVTYCIGPWMSRLTLACFGGFLPVVFALMFVWMPDSPYFLMMKQRTDEAEKSLSWLRGTTDVKEELNNIQKNIDIDVTKSGTVKDLFMTSGNRKVVVIMIGLALTQQLSGIGAVLAYSTVIFEASESTMDANVSAIIIGVTQVLSGVLTIFTVDLVGRRPLMMFSICGSFLFLVGEALYFQLLAVGNDVSSLAWLPVTAMIGFVTLYTIGLGSLPFVIFAEIVPLNVKAPAGAVNIIFSCLGSVAITKLYQVVADAYGVQVSFWGFSVFTVFSGFFIYFVLPETKQKSLMEIQELLNGTKKSVKA